MISIFKESIKLFLANIFLVISITLTIYLPVNILSNYLDYYVLSENDIGQSIRFYLLLDCILSPITIGAIIYAFFNIKQGKEVKYSSAMLEGIKNWFNLFIARLIAGVLILLGLICFIVPGIVLTVRYALLDSVVVIENAGHSLARRKSTELTLHNRWKIFFMFIVLLVLILLLVLPIFLYESFDNIYFSVLSDCIFDICFSLGTIIFFLLYWESIELQDIKEAQPNA